MTPCLYVLPIRGCLRLSLRGRGLIGIGWVLCRELLLDGLGQAGTESVNVRAGEHIIRADADEDGCRLNDAELAGQRRFARETCARIRREGRDQILRLPAVARSRAIIVPTSSLRSSLPKPFGFRLINMRPLFSA